MAIDTKVERDFCLGYLTSLHDSHGSIWIHKRKEGTFKPEWAFTIKVKFSDEDRSKTVIQYLQVIGVKARLGWPKPCNKSGVSYISIAVRINKKSEILTLIDNLYEHSIDKNRIEIMRDFLTEPNIDNRQIYYDALKEHNKSRHKMR